MPAAAGVVARLRHTARELAPTRFTVNREIWDRPPPAPAEYRSCDDTTIVVPPATVRRPDRVALGPRVLLHEGVSILVGADADGVEIGEGTMLARFAHIACARRVTIGRHVSSSDHVAVLDTWGDVDDDGPAAPLAAPVTIGDGAYLGYGCIVGPGVTIGAGAFVGEGAVVVDDVAAHTVVYGNPARAVRRLTPAGWVGERHP